MSVPVLGYAWFLELVNCEGSPEKKDFDNSELEKTPEIEVVPDVRQVNIADAFLLVDGDVLPVQAYRPL